MASGSAVHRQSKEADRTACNRGATAHRSDSRRTRRHLTPEWSVPSVRRARGRRSPPPPLTPLSAPEKIGRRRRKWGFRTAKLGFDPGGENVSHPMASNGRRCSGLSGPAEQRELETRAQVLQAKFLRLNKGARGSY
jgi:hypothetical protein